MPRRSNLRAIVRFGDLDVDDVVDFGPEAVIPQWRVQSVRRIQPVKEGSTALVAIHWRNPEPWSSAKAWNATYSVDETVMRVPEAVRKETHGTKAQNHP